MKAEVSESYGVFEIKNLNDYDWTDVKLDLNGRTMSSGYIYKPGRIMAGKSICVAAIDFTDLNGTRFNPITQKPLKIYLDAKTPNGFDSYGCEWK